MGVASKVEVTFSGFCQVKLLHFCNPSQLRNGGASNIITVQYLDNFLNWRSRVYKLRLRSCWKICQLENLPTWVADD